MSPSLSRLLIHLVFSTKNREPYLAPDLQSELFLHLGRDLEQIGCRPVRIAGTNDHVHLLFELSRTRTIAFVVETLKTSSAKWIKSQGEGYRDFYWQSGYGAFSVSQSEAARVDAYLRNQAQHHARMTYQAEFRALLERHGVEYDEKSVWD